MRMGDDHKKWTWDKGDVVWERVSNPNAKPIIAPDQIEAAKKLLTELKAKFALEKIERGRAMTDAILFSAKPSIVNVDDAIAHLESHKELYWSVRFPIAKENFSFPILGFMQISGHGQVEYRALITDVVSFEPGHYDNPQIKPEAWRRAWEDNRGDVRAAAWKNTLIITEITPFTLETRAFKKIDGEPIKQPPFGYARVLLPNEESSPGLPSPVSIAEKNLEDIVIHQLGEIEFGLRLHERQLSTPAGRLDLLCKDVDGNYVVIELKKTKGTDQVVGQILRYMGWVKEQNPAAKVRGVIIVAKIDEALRYALKAVTGVQAKRV